MLDKFCKKTPGCASEAAAIVHNNEKLIPSEGYILEEANRRYVLIGLAGYAGVGKNTVADLLVKEYGFQKVAFADPIGEAVRMLNPYIPDDSSEPTGERRFIRLNQLVKKIGWRQAEKHPEVLRLTQIMGTQIGRNLIGQDTWVNLAARKFGPRTVVTDTRFPNEARLIKSKGGILIRVHRQGIGPINQHISDRASETWNYDYHIHNDGSLDELAQKIRDIIVPLLS